MARQKLGQHFLVKGRVLDRIADAACGAHVSLAVEIGPGRGALTERLLARSDRVIAIELDPALADHLRERCPGESSLEIIQADALAIDWSQWGGGILVGNLPYYVATPIISRYLRNPGPLRPAVFLIQKEVAERIAAKPGGREYGYLSVECQLLANVEYLFTVPPRAFQPPPQVDSAVIRLSPRPSPLIEDTGEFLRFISLCFRQKRKILRNNLAGSYPAEWYESLPEISRRAEQLGLEEFLDLYRNLTLYTKPNR